MANRQVGVIGATSLVGQLLLPRLVDAGCEVFAFTRRKPVGKSDKGVKWKGIPGVVPGGEREAISSWLCVAPIWVLPDHFSMLEAYGVRRIIALSSTSRFAKLDSADPSERQLARRLEEAEKAIQGWAEARGIEWVILRPTLIYGLGQDKNVSEIARFIRRFGFFPLFGRAQGLRQPVHADDVAQACVTTLLLDGIVGSYNLSGGETLSYREMVECIFRAMERPARVVSVPLWVFHMSVAVMRFLPRYRHWSSAMAQRMNQNLVFDHEAATAGLGYQPRAFSLTEKDLPF
ncbi:MAG: NAD-dependent epimerase/dehydratase family protein [Aequoribacter sp.]|uniref:NAD-dependent epimerase/dehydratase family protein n=1 Tax=Aequoribacter sp. TaxID=2847771 RepID=UPI003C58D2F8